MDQNYIFFQWFSNCFDGIYRFFWVGLLFFWSFSIVMVIFRLGLEHLLSISRTSVVGLLADRDGPHLTFKILLLVQCSDGHAWSTTSSLRTNALWRFDRACDRMRGILSTTQPNSHTLYYSSIPKRNGRKVSLYSFLLAPNQVLLLVPKTVGWLCKLCSSLFIRYFHIVSGIESKEWPRF